MQNQAPPTTSLDIEAAAKHNDAIYLGHNPDLWIPVSGSPPGGGGWRTKWVRAGDRDGFLAAVQHWDEAGSEVFVPVALYAAEQDKYHHGGRNDVAEVVSLFADLDCSTGRHAAEHLPAKVTVKSWMSATWPTNIPQPLLIDSGGGYHLWLPLRDPLAPDDAADIMRRWRLWWEQMFGGLGWTLDAGPCSQPAQKPRAAGSRNRKTPNHPLQVTIIRECAGRVSLSALNAQLPPLPPKPERRVAARLGAALGGERVERDPTAPPRLGDRLALAVPVGELLEALGCEGIGGGHWTRPTGTPGHDHITVYPGDDDKPERMTVFSSILQSDWDILEEENHSWTSWDLLGRVVCGGDWSLAARVAASVLASADPTGELVEILSRGADAAMMLAAFPPGVGMQEDKDYIAWLTMDQPEDRDPDYDPYAGWMDNAPPEDPYVTAAVVPYFLDDDDTTDAEWPDGGPAEDPMADIDWDAMTAALTFTEWDPTDSSALVPALTGMSIQSAIEALSAGHPVRAEYKVGVGNETAVVSSERGEHGLCVWRTEKTPESGEVTWELHVLAPWIAWRPKVTRHLDIGHDGKPKDLADDEWCVELVTASGRRWRRGGLTVKESLSLDALDELGSGQPMPISALDIGRVRNMLRVLPPAEKVEMFHSTGWAVPDGADGPVWLSPKGSVDADGVTDAWTIGPPVGAIDDRSIVPAMAAMGFGGTEDVSLDDQFEALKLFMRITPNRPEIPVALLGAVFSSVMRTSVRAAVMIAGTADSGKSLLAATTMRFVSSAAARDRQVSMPIPGSSAPGALARARWHGGLWFVDNYFLDPDPHARANAQAANVLSVVIQASYGSQGEAKATQIGGARGVSQVTTTALITGEAKAAGSGVFSRQVVLPVSHADGIRQRGSEIDDFIDRDAKTIGARALMAGFIQDLARRMRDNTRSLADLTVRSDRMKHRWDSSHGDLGGRNVETVAVLGAGWEAFRIYARSIGREPTLPSPEVIEAALVRMVATGAREAEDSDPGLVVLEQLGAMLGGCTGHLIMPDGSKPHLQGCGWVTSTSEGDHSSIQHRGGGIVIGIVTNDRKHAVLMRAGIQEAARKGRIDGLTTAQIHAALERHHVATETKAGERVSKSLVTTRPAGWVVPLGVLGVGDGGEEPEPVEDEGPVEY